MAIGISPTVDFAFKLMLGSPDHTSVTIHFLNAILENQPKITEVEILNPLLGKETEDGKLSVLDILATDDCGRRMNIEMQTTLPIGLHQRLAYYASKLYVDQLTEGTHYSELRPAISICVLTKALFPHDPTLHLDFRLRGSGGLLLTDDLQIHLLELSKLRLTDENVYDAAPIERWAYFLRNAEKLTRDEVGRLFPDREIAEAAGVLEMISQTPEERLRYDARLKAQRDQFALEEWARRAQEDATRAHEVAIRAHEVAIRAQEATIRAHEDATRAHEDATRAQEATIRAEERAAHAHEEATQAYQEAAKTREEAVRGRAEALRQGELIGRVLSLQDSLCINLPTRAELSDYDETQLTDLAEQLRRELRSRAQ